MNKRSNVSESLTRREFIAASAATLAAASAGSSRAAASTGAGGAFPGGFVWGVASAAYQLEGAAFEDGKAPSVWDMFCRKTDTVWRKQTGDVACDHYHRYREDVALMKDLGVKAYRFSISWPRVIPEGTGKVNARGLEFYDRLVDELLKAGITPYATLFHWDFPLALYRRGGWLNRDSADWFADYVKVVVARLSDRVQDWMTENEPQCFLGLGLLTGVHAPGDKLRFAEFLQATHNALLAHGKSVLALRAAAVRKPRVGIAPAMAVFIPVTDSAADIEAARRATYAVPRDFWCNTLYLDPVFLGKYPEEAVKEFGPEMPEIRSGDMETIHQPLDFLGLNIYNGKYIKAGPDGTPVEVAEPQGSPITANDWSVSPRSIYWGPRFTSERYRNIPILITENGISCRDWVALDGQVHDPERIDFTSRYLLEVKRAIGDGVPIRGYFHWSILDNFEWAEGYKQRFGLVYVDYTTQKRIPKDSARWYSRVISSNGGILTGE